MNYIIRSHNFFLYRWWDSGCVDTGDRCVCVGRVGGRAEITRGFELLKDLQNRWLCGARRILRRQWGELYGTKRIYMGGKRGCEILRGFRMWWGGWEKEWDGVWGTEGGEWDYEVLRVGSGIMRYWGWGVGLRGTEGGEWDYEVLRVGSGMWSTEGGERECEILKVGRGSVRYWEGIEKRNEREYEVQWKWTSYRISAEQRSSYNELTHMFATVGSLYCRQSMHNDWFFATKAETKK